MIEIIQQKLAKLNPDEIRVYEYVPSEEQLIKDRFEASTEMGITHKDLHTICSMPDKLQLFWQFDRPPYEKRTFAGEICITNPIDALEFGHDLYSEDLKQEDFFFVPDDLVKKVFDDHPYSADGYLTLISLNESKTDFKLYYLFDYKILPLQLTIMQYMDLLPKCMGYASWQLFFVKSEFKSLLEIDISFYNQMVSDLNFVFGNEDYSIFDPKW